MDNKDTNGAWEWNFKLSNGAVSQLNSNSQLHEVRLNPAGRAIKRIVLWQAKSSGKLS